MMSKSTKFAKKPTQPSKPHWTPHKYQLKAAEFLVSHGAAGLLLDPGLGKTSITLAAFSTLRESGVASGALVLAPLRPAQQVWPEELDGWAEFAGLKYVVLHGKDKEELVRKKADVYIINYEGLKWLHESGHLKRMLRDRVVDTLVCDELSKLKNSASQRFKLLKPYLPKFARRWGLTGSPASNGLMDLFGQLYVLDQGRSLGQYITHFRAQYCVPEGDYGWRLRVGADAEIYERVRPLVLRMQAEDYLDMPEITYKIHKIDLPAPARKLYKEFERDLVAGIKAGTITAANEGVKSGKLRQIAAGAIYYSADDPLVRTPQRAGYEELHTAKLDALEDLVDELQGAPILVGYEFQHTLDQIKQRFKNAAVLGGTSAKELKMTQDAWNAGQLPLLFANPASVGHGLNLQKGGAAHVAFLTPPWDYELFDQFVRRVYRQGNKAKHVFVHLFVAAATVESVRVMVKLRRKDATQQAFFDAMRDELLNSAA